MFGFSCWVSAVRVAAGIESRLTNSTASPDRPAQAAAGIAYSGRSPDVTITSGDGLPRATLAKWSTAALSSYGSLPLITVLLRLPGLAVLSPTTIAWAGLGSVMPFGRRRPSVCAVTGGMEPPLVRSTGARSGAAESAPAAITDCQLPWSATTTAGGRVDASVEGKRAE